MEKKDEIKEKYRKSIAEVIMNGYPLMLVILLLVLGAFTISDLKVHKMPALTFTRIAPAFFSMAIIALSFTPYQNKTKWPITLNNLLGISLILMGFFILIITFHTDIFDAALLAIVICTLAAFFLIKGTKDIMLVFIPPFVFMLAYIPLVLKPELHKYQLLMNPFAIYLGIFAVALFNERHRFNEFYFKEKLEKEKNLTDELYKETAAQNEELQQQKEEILSINDQLEERKEELQINLEVISDLNNQLKKKNKAITASINYARRIQETILPSEGEMSALLKDYFILYKPSNIVSGDFYWIHVNGNYDILAAIDCTGHGVPGGFMSMLSYSLLNDVVQNNKIESAGHVLNLLKEKLTLSLHQSNEKFTQSDGLDISLCLFDKQRSKVQFAGAYMPLIIIRNHEIIQIKGDRMPIGRFFKEKPSFTNHEIAIEANDVFYLYSDGYHDQMGGPDKKRFLTSRLKNRLLEVNQMPFDKQKAILDQTIEDWKGHLDQIDDIMVLGFKV